jgi:subtilisin family serine protease
MRIAVIDSGVHADHPHVRGVAGGVSITPDGSEDPDFVDKLGHGTAVTAAIREKAPDTDRSRARSSAWWRRSTGPSETTCI